MVLLFPFMIRKKNKNSNKTLEKVERIPRTFYYDKKLI